VAVGFFPVAGQEVRKPGTQIPGHVLHDHGHAVRFLIQSLEQFGVAELGDRLVGQILLLLEPAGDFLEESSAGVHHVQV